MKSLLLTLTDGTELGYPFLRAQSPVPLPYLISLFEIESDLNPCAVRFEPDFKYFCSPEAWAQNLHITYNTEIVCQKMSWGLGQIMGATAREDGFTEHLTKLVNPVANVAAVCTHLRKLWAKYDGDLTKIFQAYNGGHGAVEKGECIDYAHAIINKALNHLNYWSD